MIQLEIRPRQSVEVQLNAVMARVNFVLNTSEQHVTPAPEWVLKTLRGENPQAESAT